MLKSAGRKRMCILKQIASRLFFIFKVIKVDTVGLHSSSVWYIAVNLFFVEHCKMNMFLQGFRAAMSTKMRTKVVLDVGESLSVRKHSKNQYHSLNALRQGCNRPSEDSASQTWDVASIGEIYFPVTFSILQ